MEMAANGNSFGVKRCNPIVNDASNAEGKWIGRLKKMHVCQICSVVENPSETPRLEGQHFELNGESIASDLKRNKQLAFRVFTKVRR